MNFSCGTEASHTRAVSTRRVRVLLATMAAFALLACAAGRGSALTAAGPTAVDFSLYFLGSSMTGEIAVGNASADLDMGFGDIMDRLEFGAMGFGRVAREPWSFTAEIVYMGLGASKDRVSSNFDQWVVEPRVGYRISPRLEPFVGVRYNNLSGEIAGPFGRSPSGTQDWWDPIVGATANVPLSATLALAGRGDIGGFGVGSDLTWQIHPYLDWTIMPQASLQAGYRWLGVDYENAFQGQATSTEDTRFRWDVVTQGPQLGVTVRVAP